MYRSLFLIVLAPAVLACDDEDAVAAGQCDWGNTGPSGGASVALASAEHDLDSDEAQVANTFGIGRHGGLDHQRLAASQWGDCGGGVAFVSHDDDEPALGYFDLATETAELVSAAAPQTGQSLYFDSSCAPHVVVSSSGAYKEHTRDGDGWAEATLFDPDSAPDADDIDGLSHRALDIGRDDRVHLFARGTGGDELRLVHGSRAADEGASWSFEVLPLPELTDVHDLAVDSEGAIHLVYNNTDYPCDPCDITLYYAKRPPSGDWAVSTVQRGIWSDSGDELAQDATLAIDHQDRPYVAAQFQTRVVTGSLTSTSLRVYGWVDGDFCIEEVVTRGDGYHGSDGEAFTGAQPALEIDSSGRLHVLFSDLAAWHTSDGSNTIPGQLRYALRSGTTWQITTLVDQTGQTERSTPLQGMDAPNLALNVDGTAALIASVEWEWETSSIYNTTDHPLSTQTVARVVDIDGD